MTVAHVPRYPPLLSFRSEITHSSRGPCWLRQRLQVDLEFWKYLFICTSISGFLPESVAPLQTRPCLRFTPFYPPRQFLFNFYTIFCTDVLRTARGGYFKLQLFLISLHRFVTSVRVFGCVRAPICCYKYKYLQTVHASLLHIAVAIIRPWARGSTIKN